MATVVRMPAALAGETEGAIQTWMLKVGDTVQAGEPLAEIETEKAVVEFEAEVGGTVARLLVQPGDSVLVGAPIAVIVAAGEGDDAVVGALAEAGIEAAPQPSVSATPAPPEPETAPEPAAAAAAAAAAAQTSAAAVEGTTSLPPGDSGGRRFASPIVRRLARERGVDLTGLTGTGPEGRIVRRDLDGAGAAVTPVPPAARPASASAPPESGRRVALTGMRRAIARRLTESKTTVPHFYVTAHCQADALLELRRQVNATAERKVSLNDFVLKAVAGALRAVPSANAIWGGDHIAQFERVDLAVAVAVEGGLLTPVLRGVDSMTLTQVSEAVADVAARARAGKLRQDDLEGGSFSVSNLGMYGVDEFSAILNPPQSGILAVGAAKERAIVLDGQLAIGHLMTVTLSADHRVIDGAVAAEWMKAFVTLIENPIGILI